MNIWLAAPSITSPRTRLMALTLNEETSMRKLSEIADEIRQDWYPMNYAAIPYCEAMLSLESINDRYFADSAKSVVLYFLANAQTWRGATARRIKAELKGMCK